MERLAAIVLAGDRTGDDQAAGLFGGRKALLKLAGRAMAGYVLEALAKAKTIGDTYVVANRALEIKEGLIFSGEDVRRVHFLEGADTPVRSVLKTIKDLKLNFPILILTGDNPLLTPDIIDWFTNAALKEDEADVVVALVEKSRVVADYPKMRRTYYHLKGESYGGCNLYALLTPKALGAATFWLGVEKDRKKALKMVASFGFTTLLGALFRTLTIEKALQRASKTLKAEVRALMVPTGRIAIDVDKPDDVPIVEEILKADKKSG
ncbi:MAG: nucleotidyltransferase family protein [Sphingomonadales bacterium]